MRAACRDVVVSGMGAVCALGRGQEALWKAIEEGRDGIEPIRRFSTDGFRVRTGAVVADCASLVTLDPNSTERLCRGFAEDAALEAMRDAGVERSGALPARMGLVFGTGLGGLGRPIHLLAEDLARRLGLRGPCLTVSTACSSSTGAIGVARDLLANDAVDLVLAGGSDVLSPEVFAGFHALGVLSPAKCAPFSRPLGTTMGEGAGFVVLERASSARERGARVRVFVSGYGLSGDAFHETSPDPTGSGVERAVRGALADAALTPGDIGYVNVHGSGTEANDPSEWRGIQRGLGQRALQLPLSSTKGALGHAQGAAGVLEAIVTVLAMEHGVVPPTLHYAGPRPHSPADPVGEPRPRALVYEHALCLNSAFGGANAAVILSRSGRVRGAAPRRPVNLAGVGLVGPYGLGVRQFLDAGRRGDAAQGRVPPFSFEQIVPTAESRGLDPMSRFLTASAALSLADAGVPRRGRTGDRIGLFVGASRPSPSSAREFRQSIEERGLRGLSAAAFTRIVLNAPAGFCSKLLSLRGPLTTITTGPGSGLVAIALAAEFLSTREEVDWIVAGAASEQDPGGPGDASRPGAEGAACMTLGAGPALGSGAAEAGVRVEGWGFAGRGGLSDAIARARCSPGAAPAGAEALFSESDWVVGEPGSEDPVASALACAAAVLALQEGGVERALVTSSADRATTVALLLSSRGASNERRS